MLHKAWNSKGEMPYCFPRSSIKFQGHTGQNITDFDPNWAFPDYRPVAAFKSLRFALFYSLPQILQINVNVLFDWSWPGVTAPISLVMHIYITNPSISLMPLSHCHECATQMQYERNRFDICVHSYSLGETFLLVPGHLHWFVQCSLYIFGSL